MHQNVPQVRGGCGGIRKKKKKKRYVDSPVRWLRVLRK